MEDPHPAVGRSSTSNTAAVIVVAGGVGRRLGGTEPGDKARVLVAGRPLLAHVVDDLPSGVFVVAVGPQLDGVDGVDRWAQESPPGSGPLAAVAAGMRVVDEHLGSAADGFVGVLGGDMPTAGAVLALLEQGGPTTSAMVVVDRHGHRNPLAARWSLPALRDALATVGELGNRPMRELFNSVDVAEVIDVYGVAFDIDRPEDLARFDPRPASDRAVPPGGMSPNAANP